MGSDGLPDTIYNPEKFKDAQWNILCPHCNEYIGFDGVFHWGWLIDLLPRKMSPMDFDGVIESQLHYLIMETKGLQVEIPKGQLYTLGRLNRAKDFVVMQIWGKNEPEQFTWIKRDGEPSGIYLYDVKAAREFVRKWVEYAEHDIPNEWI